MFLHDFETNDNSFIYQLYPTAPLSAFGEKVYCVWKSYLHKTLQYAKVSS